MYLQECPPFNIIALGIFNHELLLFFYFFTWYEKRIIFCTRVPVSFRLSLSNLMVQIRPTCIQTSPHRSTDSVTWVHWHSGNSSDTDITITSLFYCWDIKCVHILTVHNAQFRSICFNVTSAFKMSLCWVSNLCMYTEKWRNPWLRDKNPPKKKQPAGLHNATEHATKTDLYNEDRADR